MNVTRAREQTQAFDAEVACAVIVGNAGGTATAIPCRDKGLLLVLEEGIEHHASRIAIAVVGTVAVDIQTERRARGNAMLTRSNRDLRIAVARLRNPAELRGDREAIETDRIDPLAGDDNVDIVLVEVVGIEALEAVGGIELLARGIHHEERIADRVVRLGDEALVDRGMMVLRDLDRLF